MGFHCVSFTLDSAVCLCWKVIDVFASVIGNIILYVTNGTDQRMIFLFCLEIIVVYNWQDEIGWQSQTKLLEH